MIIRSTYLPCESNTDFAVPSKATPLKVEFYFIPMARCYAAAFFVTLLLSSIATFSAVSWSAETDKIILYYGFLNPCVLFDHYPAKVVAMTGMSCFILIGILYDLMVFFQAHVCVYGAGGGPSGAGVGARAAATAAASWCGRMLVVRLYRCSCAALFLVPLHPHFGKSVSEEMDGGSTSVPGVATVQRAAASS